MLQKATETSPPNLNAVWKRIEDRTEGAEEDVELKQVLEPKLLGHEIVPLPGDIDHNTKEDQEGSEDTDTMAIGTARLEPGMLGMIEALLQREPVVGITCVTQIGSDRDDDRGHGSDEDGMDGFGHGPKCNWSDSFSSGPGNGYVGKGRM